MTENYCCFWCHKALTREETYVTSSETTVCKPHRSVLAVPLTQWNKPCDRSHKVDSRPSLDDVMDWFSLARESGECLAEFQKKYPYYAKKLAEFDAFLTASESDERRDV